MIIDGNGLIKKEYLLSKSKGGSAECYEMRKEFIQQVKENGDHCNCPEACPHHGNCFECVVIHRGHQNHVPYCMRQIVNNRLSDLLDLTEGSLIDSIKTQNN